MLIIRARKDGRGQEAKGADEEESSFPVSRGKRALVEADWETLAQYMNENHRIQHAISHVGERNLKMITAALENGALAAKLAGAGGGGTIIVLTHDPDKQIPALKEAGAARFLTLRPSEGVRVDEAVS